MQKSAIFEYLQSGKADLIISKDDSSSHHIATIANFLHIKPFVLPQMRVTTGEDLRSYITERNLLFKTLYDYYSCEDKKILISPVHTLSFPLPKKEYLKSFRFEFAQTINTKELKDMLYRWGYHFVDIVTAEGEVSFRGDIIDIYPINSKKPYRISLFDEEIEEIHPFDENTQRKEQQEIESFKILPAFLALNESEFEALKSRVESSKYECFVKDIDSLGLWHLEELAQNYLQEFTSILSQDLSSDIEEMYSLNNPLIPRSFYPASIIPSAKVWQDLEVSDPNLIIQTHKDKKITVIASNESTVRGSQLIDIQRLNFVYIEGELNIISPTEVILSINKPYKQKRVKKPSIVLDEIRVGEYVVHEVHGVGVFKGIQKQNILGVLREFVVIEYQNEDRLFVPVDNLEVIDRYIANGGSLPVIDKLGKASFKRLKGKVREKLFAIASHIINLGAKRALQRGIVIDYDPIEMTLFSSKAGFIHTQDQTKAIEDILTELKSGKMMDRLLSADVGFGKTEVAMHAIFATIKSGYQAMMIAPTTLLSSQHYRTLRERFASWDIKVAKLDRYTSTKEKKEIMRGLEEGSIDIVVGTHALLKAKFKNLALVIIDEEHKFGVKQKEQLKEISLNTHLLSMSATPIPRSLNMALSHIKTFSEILTPPTQRVGVRTFVKNYDTNIIKEAILRERRRGGQIFYVYNSIAGIEEKAKEIQKILPDIRLTILHSKISPTKTEEEMMKFERGEYDLLLSTSIVESGIHLPNANTMIVEGANNFGIADLHQLRGRVGRGGVEGYCYFLVEDRDKLSQNAISRLIALESHSELGSGAVLAFYDLQIRGGGNLIGEAQSGHIKQIGYSLYIRMLEDAIKELSGKKDEEISQSVDIKLQVDAYLSDELISEDRLRLELYRRLSQAQSVSEVYDIEEEIADRFGKLDTVTKQFIDIMVIKVLALKAKVSKVSSYEQRVFIEFAIKEQDRVILQSPSKDDDDIIATALEYLRRL